MNTETITLTFPRTRAIRDVIAGLVVLQVADKAVLHQRHDEKTPLVMSSARYRACAISALLDILHVARGREAAHGSKDYFRTYIAKTHGWTLVKPVEEAAKE